MEANGNLLGSESPTKTGEKPTSEQVTSNLKEITTGEEVALAAISDPSSNGIIDGSPNPKTQQSKESSSEEPIPGLEPDPTNHTTKGDISKDEVNSEQSDEHQKTVNEDIIMEEQVDEDAKPPETPNKDPQEPEVTSPDISMADQSQTSEMDSSAALAAEESSSADPHTPRKERKKKKNRSELDRLLMDEGTVKILMGAAARGSQAALSKEEKLKALNKHRQEAINQVRDSSKTKIFNKVSLRLKSKSRRQQQQEQRNAKKAKLSEPASKIIRRRSSSSNFNFSSRSPSPAHVGGPIQSSEEDTVQVRVHDSVGYITIDAEAITFNTQITSRLTAILNNLKQNESVTVVQVTTTSDFIQGLDIQAIRSEADDGLRESMADSMVACLDSLLKTLINYPKLLVAGVSGDAVDFGVLILSYFDMVYASDKATFQTNYGKNGYLPECLQLFPKNRLTYAMLYTGKKLTATEGVTSGLVTEVLWPAKFQEELASRIRTITTASQEVLLQTKGEVNTKNSSKLELARDLRSSWLRF